MVPGQGNKIQIFRVIAVFVFAVFVSSQFSPSLSPLFHRRLHFRHRLIAVFTFTIVSSPSSPSPSSHRLVVVFACAIASSLSLYAPSPRRCHCLRHRLVAVIVCAIVSSLSSPSLHRRLHLVAVFAVASSPSSPRRCLCRRLIAVFVAAYVFASSPCFACGPQRWSNRIQEKNSW
ncbi:Uncharacterized protein APZ42_034493 [Daphnia magna]|uniref:Uncharacterized protein n=1 Tax=Daphnia magna TaxID=35525 RepID=A0A164K7Z6_9CRUS|nr:Uncharacterized protein APZ42_034493 [Daphnia magna]